MAERIGVYDSGIGGLTTLALLQAKLPDRSFLYLADTARMPFGSKSREEIFDAAAKALKTLRALSDVVVFGCNTASVTVRPEGVFALCPDLTTDSPENTLLLATPRTVAGLEAREKGVLCADTPELAVLTEIQMSLSFKSRRAPDLAELSGYLKEKLSPFVGRARTVLLGCSHYVYAEKEIRAVLGDARYFDGNDALTEKVRLALSPEKPPRVYSDSASLPPTKLMFTGGGESAKYAAILTWLHRTYVPRFVKTET